MSNANKTLFLRHDSGATHALRGRRLAKLLRELKAGRGMAEILQLQANGYTETLGGLLVDSLTYEATAHEAQGGLHS